LNFDSSRIAGAQFNSELVSKRGISETEDAEEARNSNSNKDEVLKTLRAIEQMQTLPVDKK
jgi:hypothetical protein